MYGLWFRQKFLKHFYSEELSPDNFYNCGIQIINVLSHSWEADSRSAGQEVLHFDETWKSITVFIMALRTVSLASSIQLTHFKSHVFKSRFSVFLSSTSGSTMRFSFLQILRPKFFVNLTHACYMPCLSHHSWFNHPDNIWWRVQVMELFILEFQASMYFSLSPCWCFKLYKKSYNRNCIFFEGLSPFRILECYVILC